MILSPLLFVISSSSKSYPKAEISIVSIILPLEPSNPLIVSVPASAEMTKISEPVPPIYVLSPAPPDSSSEPTPPCRVSSPPSPQSVSLPSLPNSWLSLLSPVARSSNLVNSRSSMPKNISCSKPISGLWASTKLIFMPISQL